MRKLGVLISALVSTFCAAANPPVTVTIHGSVEQVKSAAVASIIPFGYQLTSESTYQVVAAKDMQGMQGAFATAMIGGDALNKAFDQLTFSLAPSGDDVIVVVREDVVSPPQGINGQVNRISLDSKKQRANLQNLLYTIKLQAEYKKPFKAYLGIFFVSKDSPELKIVVKDSPAEKAGLLPGDMLVSVSGKPTKSAKEAIAELDKYNPGDALKLAYLRAGKIAETDVTLIAPPQ